MGILAKHLTETTTKKVAKIKKVIGWIKQKINPQKKTISPYVAMSDEMDKSLDIDWGIDNVK